MTWDDFMDYEPRTEVANRVQGIVGCPLYILWMGIIVATDGLCIFVGFIYSALKRLTLRTSPAQSGLLDNRKNTTSDQLPTTNMPLKAAPNNAQTYPLHSTSFINAVSEKDKPSLHTTAPAALTSHRPEITLEFPPPCVQIDGRFRESQSIVDPPPPYH